MPKLMALGIVCLLCSIVSCLGAEIENGIYILKAEPPGRKIRSQKGAEVILGERLGQGLGTATISSTRNDNAEFTLNLKNAGPLGGFDGTSPTAIVIDGLCLTVSGWSGLNPDKTINLDCTIKGENAARKIAAAFKIEPLLRHNPGHKFGVRWIPDKAFYQLGQVVTLKMEIRNTGQIPFTFQNGGQLGARDNQFGFTARHADGGGKEVPDTGDATNFGGLSRAVTLKPGESFTRSVAIDRWVHFTEPDTYKITGSYTLDLEDPQGVPTPYQTIWDDVAKGECSVKIVPRQDPATAPTTGTPP